jgi:hypothetical protein
MFDMKGLQMTSNQLAAFLRNRRRDEIHARRMQEDLEYRERKEREAREYEEFIERFGPPIHHLDD